MDQANAGDRHSFLLGYDPSLPTSDDVTTY